LSQLPALQKLRTMPGSVAIRQGKEVTNWLDLFSSALSIADLLSLGEGTPVAILMGNHAAYYEVLLGATLAGVWLTPINSHLTAPEIEYVMADSGARILFTDRDAVPGNFDARIVTLPMQERQDSVLDAEAVYARIMACMPGPAGGFLMYTSGTTGRPKGVKRSSPDSVGATLAAWSAIGTSIGLDGVGTHLVTGPIYHAAPGLYSLYDLLNGATLELMTRWDTRTALELIEQRRITHTHLVPTMFVRLLRDRPAYPREYDLSSLSLVLHGAAPVANAIKKEMIAWWGEVLVEYWGGSESGIITRVESQAWLLHPGTVGKPLPQYELSVRDDDFTPLFSGEVGMLYARKMGQAQPFSYFNDPEKTARSYVDDWFTLGDMGWVDEAGYAYIADRRNNLIISGGVNIYPAEVEGVLLEHPGVVDVAVIGVDDKEWGKTVHAYVQPVAQHRDDLVFLDSLREFACERLAKFKVPRSMELINPLPRFDSGKLYLNRLPPPNCGRLQDA
jgi:long-chain acyl-CoA synthetase